MPNPERLTTTLAHIEANPALLDQSEWLPRPWCGSAQCFAGHTVALAGLPAAYVSCRRGTSLIGVDIPAVFLTDLPADLIAAARVPDPGPLRGVYYAVEDPGGRYVPVPHVAQLLLGLDDHQADALFSPMNTLEDLRAIVGALCSPDGAA